MSAREEEPVEENSRYAEPPRIPFDAALSAASRQSGLVVPGAFSKTSPHARLARPAQLYSKFHTPQAETAPLRSGFAGRQATRAMASAIVSEWPTMLMVVVSSNTQILKVRASPEARSDWSKIMMDP